MCKHIEDIMDKLSIVKTRILDLCLSCEICSAVCPKIAISFEYKKGQFLPLIDEDKCIKCGLCLKLCPGIDMDPFELRKVKNSKFSFDGSHLESYSAYSKNLSLRNNSASGGVITNLIYELLKNKEIEYAFLLPFDIFLGEPARLKAINTPEDVWKSAKSKYLPVSVYEIINTFQKSNNQKCAIVGTPCQLLGIKKYLSYFKLSDEKIFFLGLFCDKILNFNVIRYFEDRYIKKNENLINFEFRTKEKHGWPGNTKLCFDSGRVLIVDKDVRVKIKNYFQLNRCLYCLNGKLNPMADISFGDCLIKKEFSINGKSSVIIRTEKGKQLFERHMHLFNVSKENIEKIRESQGLLAKKDTLEYMKIFTRKNIIYRDLSQNDKSEKVNEKNIIRLQKHIIWGQKYNIHYIKISLYLLKLAAYFKKLKEIGLAGIILGITIVRDNMFPEKNKEKSFSSKERDNIIVVGGEFLNKGAQAMTLTTVDQLRRRLPNKNIYMLIENDIDRQGIDKDTYNFTILPLAAKNKIRLLGTPLRLVGIDSKTKHALERIKEVISKADFFIDISGYALSSKWGFLHSLYFLLNIILAKRFSITYFVFPQSMGPFDYPFMHKIVLLPLMKLYLRYPKKLFIREKEGVSSLKKFTTRNVENACDIVFQRTDYNLFNIYKKEFAFNDYKIEPNSVGIIPSSRVFERTNQKQLYSIYKYIIESCLEKCRSIYILRHSHEDLEICENIKNMFADIDMVKMMYEDLGAIELENIIKQFSFIIASRYHSIVHSYKNGVPSLVIGWATKYYELLDSMGQLNYFIDIKNGIDKEEIKSKLDRLEENYKHEKERLNIKMMMFAKKNIFNIFGEEKY